MKKLLIIISIISVICFSSLWISNLKNDTPSQPPCQSWYKQIIRTDWYICVKDVVYLHKILNYKDK